MNHSIKTIYVVHHSHTDIGYTDLQERILDEQAHYIHSVLDIMKSSEKNADFRWNCETYFCVERFFSQATQEEKNDFFHYVKTGQMGMSASYLNFTDLLDYEVYRKRLSEMNTLFQEHEIDIKTAMTADINGISMGQRDALLEYGVEFLFTNVHTHHGMYPLYQNQNAYWWKNKEGKSLLVWNGEHYNLGNVLGIKPNVSPNFMTDSYLGREKELEDSISTLKKNVDDYLNSCEEQGYPYDFIVCAVSGVFSDNAPPNIEILRTIEHFQKRYGTEVCLKMVSLQELYSAIKDKLKDAPVLKGDFTDWWANGVGSTPYAVKHYKEAQRIYHLCGRLDPAVYQKYPQEARIAEDNLLLYSEHTWGHSATITNPYDTMVLNLDMRKTSYASKAHESASLMLNKTAAEAGDILRYYNTNGKIKVINTGTSEGMMPVEFYIESMSMKNAQIIRSSDKKEIPCQISSHPRGVLISFIDTFSSKEVKEYEYRELPPIKKVINTRQCYIGAERIQDIVNDYEPITYKLPYEIENDWFKINYRIGEGITSFYNKREECEMLGEGLARFFTPIYECTSIRTNDYSERSILGRNVRGKHAVQYQGELIEVKCLEQGKIFTTLEFVYSLEGTNYCSVVFKIYHLIPKIDFKLKLAKTISNNIESIYLPLTLELPDRKIYLEKGTEPFMPGVEQLPGACIEYYMSDYGMIYQTSKGSVSIQTLDVPLFYMGEMKHHSIKLCDGKLEYNDRDIYSWVMNNIWETNFKMDLSGYAEFRYSISLGEKREIQRCFDELLDGALGTYTIMIE